MDERRGLREPVRYFPCGARPQHHHGEPDRLKLAGLAGLSVATLAIMLPSCSLAFIAGRVVTRWSDRRWIRLLKEGLVPVALGLILASGISMMRTADQDAPAIAISLATAAFVVFSRRNPLWALAAGTYVYVTALRFGLLHLRKWDRGRAGRVPRPVQPARDGSNLAR
jgi:chromate transport protein ChrA